MGGHHHHLPTYSSFREPFGIGCFTGNDISKYLSKLTHRWKKKPGDKRQRTAPHSRGEEILGQEEITFVGKKLLFNTRFLRFFSPIYVDKRQRQRAAPHSRRKEIVGQEEIAFVEGKLLFNTRPQCFSPGADLWAQFFSLGANPARPQI